MNKILSIIVPSYNMEKYLPKCLGSLVIDDAELLQRLDVIVVNDGSKDRTSEIAHDFESKYPGVFRVIDKPNGYYGSCVNAALPIAQGKYVKMLDADDYFDNAVFADYLAFVNQVSDELGPDLIVNDMDVVDETGLITGQWKIPNSDGNTITLKEILDKGPILPHQNVAFRKQIYYDIHYKQTEGIMYTDTEWVFEPMLSVNLIAAFHKSLYKYFIGREDQSMNVNVKKRSIKQQLQVLTNILDVYCKTKESVSYEHRRYMEKYLECIFLHVIPVYFSSVSIYRLAKEFIPVDNRLAKIVPWIRDSWGSCYIRIPFRFDCYKAWKKGGRFRWFYTLIYRLYKPLPYTYNWWRSIF